MKICRDKIYGSGKLYEYEGKVYRSPKRLAETYGLPWQSLAHFLARCDTVDEAMKRCIEQQEHKIILWGKEYRDRFEVAEAFCINQASISYGISCKKMSLEEIVLDLLSREPIWFEGKKYSTIVDLCACYQVQPSNVMERLRYGKDLHEAVYRPVRNNGKVFEIEYGGKVYQNAAFLCREYNISSYLVSGQVRYEKEKTFVECFQIIRQLRDECGWPDDQVFAYIPRCKIEGVFYKRLTDFSKMIGMSAAPFNTYKSKHNCRDIIEAFQKMQKDRIPAYQTECGLFTYTQLQKMGYSYEKRKELPYVKEGLPRYPVLQKFDFNKDCMDIRRRYEELFEKTPRVKKKETER